MKEANQMMSQNILHKEGEVRIPSGCAISGIFSKSGKKVNGREIIKSIATMHDRSNGLGGGFARDTASIPNTPMPTPSMCFITMRTAKPAAKNFWNGTLT